MNIKAYLGLEDRASSTLKKATQEALATEKAYSQLASQVDRLQKRMGDLSAAGLQDSNMFKSLSAASKDLTQQMTDMEQGINKSNTSLGSMIGTIVGWAAIIKGTKKLMDMSDTYTQTTARINMMNDGLQTTEELQNMIYKSAQRSRASYNTMADTVAKLGNQAGATFGNNSKQIVQFTELLNKAFTVSGLDSTAIDSVMYNLTQSLSSGKLLGQDYRILKQNAPQMIKYLQEFYGTNAAGLDEMVSQGQVTAQGIKQALFGAADDINEKFSQMPITFDQLKTKIGNSFQKIAQPILKILSRVAEWLDSVFTFLEQNEYIIYMVATAVGVLVGALVIYNLYQTITTIYQNIMNSALLKTIAITALVVIAILALAAIIIYAWNTNDEFAEAVLFAWDSLRIGIRVVGLGIKTVFYAILNVVGFVAARILDIIQTLCRIALAPINLVLGALEAIGAPGVHKINVDFADKFNAGFESRVKARTADIENDWNDIKTTAAGYNATRKDRVANRQKIGINDGVGDAVYDAITDNISPVIGTDSTGGKAVKTTTDDDLLSDEDIQLLLDVATRDYKLNYQQVTPNITLTFGDIRETADVDNILEQVADRLEEIYDGNLEVNPA